jgi:hypothetical protein
MLTHSYFGVGFWRGLNSAAEVFAPYSGSYERSPIGQMLAVRIIPGGADRLLSMAEKELTHRIEDARRGRYLGWSLATVAVVAAAVVSLSRFVASICRAGRCPCVRCGSRAHSGQKRGAVALSREIEYAAPKGLRQGMPEVKPVERS